MVLHVPTETLSRNKRAAVIKAIIVEDEIRSMNNLKNLLSKHCPEVEVIGDAVSVEESLELFDDPSFKPDLAFLDISLPDGLVFQMLNQLRPLDFEIIFITAFNEHAIKNLDTMKEATNKSKGNKGLNNLENFNQIQKSKNV